MRIGYDGKRAFKNFTGLGNYSRYIISLISRKFPHIETIIYAATEPGSKPSEAIGRYPQNKIRYPDSSFKPLWRSFGIIKDLKKDKIDLYHGLSNELPFGISKSGLASVVTIHDLIFLRYPGYYPKADSLIYKIKSRYACKNSDRIIAVSEQTKRDIIDFFNIPPGKIDVVYQDCGEGFKKQRSIEEKERIRLKYSLPEKFILNVGTVETRKNLLLLAKALKLTDPDVKLVVVGKEKGYAAEVRGFLHKNGLQQRVLFLKDVAYDDLPGIYQQAEIFVYPSRFEGFGIPVIEALYSDVPVIAATGSCLEEAGGKGSLYTHPDNFEQLADLIQTVLHNPGKRAEMIRAGREHLEHFKDEVISTELMNTYIKAIADAKR